MIGDLWAEASDGGNSLFDMPTAGDFRELHSMLDAKVPRNHGGLRLPGETVHLERRRLTDRSELEIRAISSARHMTPICDRLGVCRGVG